MTNDELNELEAKIKGGDELRVYHFDDPNQDLDIQDEVLNLIAELRRKRAKVKMAKDAFCEIKDRIENHSHYDTQKLVRAITDMVNAALDEIREDG